MQNEGFITHTGEITMKRILKLLPVLTLAFVGTSAHADFVDDFESYGTGVDLTAPYTGVSTLGVDSAGTGYLGSNGLQSFASPAGGWAYRSTGVSGSGPVEVSMRVAYPAAGDTTIISVGASTTHAGFTTGDPDRVDLQIRADEAGGATRVFIDTYAGGSFVERVQPSPNIGLIPKDETWYDYRLVFGGISGAVSVSGDYRVSAVGDSGAWTSIGSSTTSAGFALDQVYIGGRYTKLDDLSVVTVPEPGSMLLIGSGVLMVMCRREKKEQI